MRTIVQIIVYMVALGILNIIINSLTSQRQKVLDSSKDQGNYVVKLPSALKSIFFYAFCLGIVMFSVFSILKFKSNPTVTVGHIIFAAVIIMIGLTGMILSTTWRIEVNGNEMIIHRLCRSKIEIQMTEIEKVEIGKKGEMRLYVNSKKITTVDPFAENFSMLKKQLENYSEVK